MRTTTKTSVKLPAELKPECVVGIIDTREQSPLNLAPLRTETDTLTTGDYSVRGRDRGKFDREVHRLLAYPTRALVVESTWAAIEIGDWTRSKVTTAATIGWLLGWVAMGLPVIMSGDHKRAGRYVSRLLFTMARRRWRESRELIKSATS